MTSKEYIMKITEKLVPEMKYDYEESFSAWHDKARKKLEELLGLPLIKPKSDHFTIKEQEIKEGIEYIHFSFESEDGYEVPCCLVKKADLVKKAPLVICLQGHTSGMHISLGKAIFKRDKQSIQAGQVFAVDAAREGMVAIAIEQRYMGIRGYKNPMEISACIAAREDADANQAISALLIGRTAIGERVWDVSRTIDVAYKYFENIIIKEKTLCLGNSGGGTATFYAACMDDRIRLAVPSCSVCSFDDSIMAMNHCICNYIPKIRKYFDMGDLGALIAPRKLLVVCGDKDPIFPLNGVRKSFTEIQKVYNYLQKKDNCRLLVGDGGHRFYPEEAWPLIHALIS